MLEQKDQSTMNSYLWGQHIQIYFFKSIKHLDFLDVPDAKVAVPPQKPAEGRVTKPYLFRSAVLYLC